MAPVGEFILLFATNHLEVMCQRISGLRDLEQTRRTNRFTYIVVAGGLWCGAFVGSPIAQFHLHL